MKRFIMLMPMILIGVFSLTLVLAQDGTDDRGNSNNPDTNERANACYDGEELAGKCDASDLDLDGTVEAWESEAMWNCGWHYIRWEYGLISSDDFAADCAWLLPPPPKSIEPTAVPTATPEKEEEGPPL